MQMTFCQPTVIGLLLFHVQDEPSLPAWQSGVYYADGTPKTSLPAVRASASAVHRGIAASCPGLLLTPKLVLKPARPTATGVKVTVTCSLDCAYVVGLDGRRLKGSAVGGKPKVVSFAGKLRKGRHVVSATAAAALNAGPPAS